ncbi:hypothetical protein MXB_2669 [Myxobolus squamalis]|nr:hypothetical protein MXB_2669 [Myxobolus squamalis]
MHESDINYFINGEIIYQSFEAQFPRQAMQNITSQSETGIAYLTNQSSKQSNISFPMMQNMSRNTSDGLNTMVSIQQTREFQNVIQPQICQFDPDVMYIQYIYQPNTTYFEINQTNHGIANSSNYNSGFVNVTNITPNYIPNNITLENTTNIWYLFIFNKASDQSLDTGSYSIIPSPMETPTKISHYPQIAYNSIENKENIIPNSGEKPFMCLVCKKGFSRKDHLRSHERTHTKERPYRCPICQRGFSRSDERKRHTKIHLKPKKLTKRTSHEKYIEK